MVWKQKWSHNSPEQRAVLFQLVAAASCPTRPSPLAVVELHQRAPGQSHGAHEGFCHPPHCPRSLLQEVWRQRDEAILGRFSPSLPLTKAWVSAVVLGLNQSVHLSFQNDKSFCGLAALYSLSLLLLSRALEGIPYALLEIQERNSASLRVDICEFSSQVARMHPSLSLPLHRSVYYWWSF